MLIGYLAAGTSTLRLGSGGFMLPNHAPLVVAEQFDRAHAPAWARNPAAAVAMDAVRP